MQQTDFLFIGKRGSHYCEQAAHYLSAHQPSSTIVFVARGESLPQVCFDWQGRYLISYLCPEVIPEQVLTNADVAAINFHPGPPEYPGIGCTNFAIYNEEHTFGVTTHHMNAQVDTGKIILVDRFVINEKDDVYSVTVRCYAHLQRHFFVIMDEIRDGNMLPESDEGWTRKPYTRRELNELSQITLDMPEKEIRRRVRAMDFPGAPGAYLNLNGVHVEARY